MANRTGPTMIYKLSHKLKSVCWYKLDTFFVWIISKCFFVEIYTNSLKKGDNLNLILHTRKKTVIVMVKQRIVIGQL